MSLYGEHLKEASGQDDNSTGYLGNLETNLYPTYHVAISPNGQYVATFNAVTFELYVCKVDSSEKSEIECGDIDTSAKLIWSIAISNPINCNEDETNESDLEMLIALSCFDERDMMLGRSLTSTPATFTYSDNLNEKNQPIYGNDDGEKGFRPVKSSTIIISTSKKRDRTKPLTVIDELGGLVRFLSDDPSQPHTVTVIIVNVNGISKASFNLSSSWWNRSFSPQIQEFFFPLKIQDELKKLYQNVPCLELLNRSIENDYFLIEDYKDRVQVVEMYNLKTDELEMIFHQRSKSAVTAFGHGSPAVAISTHKSLLAYCRGANAVTIYLMENSLEISTQIFPSIEKILSLDFINNDESLLIIAQENENSIPLIIVWDIFSYMDNAIRILHESKKLFSSRHYRLVRNCGNILLVDDSDGEILSILNDPLIGDMLFPTVQPKKQLIPLRLQYLHESEWDQAVYHTIFDQNGDHYDAYDAETRPIIVSDKEPWIHSKKYSRMSAFLDDEGTTQLIIGETTVQVWCKTSANSKEQLKYIWVVPKNRKLLVKSLEIGQREFKVTLSTHSNQSYWKEDIENIHWPFKVNVVNDACSALRHLYDRRGDPAGPQKQQEYEILVHKTENLVRQFIKERPAVWRLIDVRYDVMASLIQGHCISLVRQIIDDEESSSSTRHLHTPRLYKWPKIPKRSDLEIAIRCVEGSKQRDAVAVGLLLDYYSNNAIDNTGWMFTVSRAVPLLFDYHLDMHAKDLFSKPIFGMKEVHLDESHISPQDLPQGKLRYIQSFSPTTKLVPKDELRKIKASPFKKAINKLTSRFTHNNQLAALQKVIPGLDRGDSSALVALRLVPLPDFTVYPEGVKEQKLNLRRLPFQLLRIAIWPRGYALRKESKLSPFLKVVSKDKDGIVLDNPAMEAVIDFKWESARGHFLRHVFLFFIFALSFCILTGAVKNSLVKHGALDARASEDIRVRTFIDIIIFVFYYLGYYLLASEFAQFLHEGWRRYSSVYNFFDVASVVMPLVTYTVTFVRESRPHQLQQLTIATSFTIMVLWIELFLLLRYFSVTGNFIYIIINIVRNVWPFLAFMGIVVIAHGHAMYLLLRDPTTIGVIPDVPEFTIQDTGQKIKQDVDLTTITDNYFSNFIPSVTAVYFWINGRWDQLEQWGNFWPVTLLSLIASILLVIILQNLLIAFMSGVFDEAKSEGRLAVLKYRSELIAEYEVLQKPFGDKKGNPRHILYIGNINKLSAWLRKCEEYRKLRASSTKEKFYEGKYDDDDDNNPSSKGSKEWDITGLDVDGYEQKSIKLTNKTSGSEFYSSWNTNGFDNIKNVSAGSTKKNKRELLPVIEDTSNIQDEIVSLKDSIKTVKGSIDDRINSLEGKLTEIMNVLNQLANSK